MITFLKKKTGPNDQTTTKWKRRKIYSELGKRLNPKSKGAEWGNGGKHVARAIETEKFKKKTKTQGESNFGGQKKKGLGGDCCRDSGKKGT